MRNQVSPNYLSMLRNLDNKGGPTIFPEIGHVIGTVFTIALPTPKFQVIPDGINSESSELF